MKALKIVLGCATGLLLGALAGGFLFAVAEVIYPGTEDDFYDATDGIPAAIVFLTGLVLTITGAIAGGIYGPRVRLPAPTRTLAGVPVRLEFVEQLAAKVDEPTASKLARAIKHREVIPHLDIDDCERLLRVLEDAPAELAELRGVLLAEHFARARGEMA